jgi:putative endonuclease
MPEGGAYVYIVHCADASYYTGTARGGLDQRIAEHNSGHYGGFTAKRRPVTLVFSQWFKRITDAIAAERQLKGWSRAKKEALIRGDFDALRVLARRGQPFKGETAQDLERSRPPLTLRDARLRRAPQGEVRVRRRCAGPSG